MRRGKGIVIRLGIAQPADIPGCSWVHRRDPPLVVCGVTFVQGGHGEPAAVHTVRLGRTRPGMPSAPRSSELPPRNTYLGVSPLGTLVYLTSSCSHGLTVIITHASQLWTVGPARASGGGITSSRTLPPRCRV